MRPGKTFPQPGTLGGGFPRCLPPTAGQLSRLGAPVLPGSVVPLLQAQLNPNPDKSWPKRVTGRRLPPDFPKPLHVQLFKS